MTPTAIGLSMFGGMLLLMAVRVPIAAAMFIPGALGYWSMTNELALLNQLKGSAVARLFDSLVARQPASIGNLVARPMPEGWSFTRAPVRRG